MPSLYVALRLIGAAYLVHLGINALRAAGSGGMINLEATGASPAGHAPFRTAYLVMMTNPKAVLFFGSILTAFIPPDGSRWLMIIIALQIGLVASFLNTFAALFFSSPAVMEAFRAAGFWMSILFGILFTGLGVIVAWDVLRGFF